MNKENRGFSDLPEREGGWAIVTLKGTVRSEEVPLRKGLRNINLCPSEHEAFKLFIKLSKSAISEDKFIPLLLDQLRRDPESRHEVGRAKRLIMEMRIKGVFPEGGDDLTDENLKVIKIFFKKKGARSAHQFWTFFGSFQEIQKPVSARKRAFSF